ncbi:hypothetical protein ACE193_23515 [Bernardetia sp. OM2101]|uniref:hypothetical protein n=1 Tax=Bernardetia sp. OM2101 TaxID=3344876 RepID=UPI0035CF1BA2
MHIHKISSNFKEHQNFLAQNRKDPITGDFILEGDEVVFCASCKSVFLRDTWEYLRKQHCEQSETLVDFPMYNTLHLEVESKILFYHKPTTTQENIGIPSLVKDSPWFTKYTTISPFQSYFNKLPFILTFFSVFVIGVILQIVMRPLDIMPYAFGFMMFMMASYAAHEFYFGSRLKTTHKKFTRNVFYITRDSIGFSLPYGRKEYVLPIPYIKEMYFYEERKILDKNYCKITYNANKELN